jgi:hypothetical protein
MFLNRDACRIAAGAGPKPMRIVTQMVQIH